MDGFLWGREVRRRSPERVPSSRRGALGPRVGLARPWVDCRPLPAHLGAAAACTDRLPRPAVARATPAGAAAARDATVMVQAMLQRAPMALPPASHPGCLPCTAGMRRRLQRTPVRPNRRHATLVQGNSTQLGCCQGPKPLPAPARAAARKMQPRTVALLVGVPIGLYVVPVRRAGAGQCRRRRRWRAAAAAAPRRRRSISNVAACTSQQSPPSAYLCSSRPAGQLPGVHRQEGGGPHREPGVRWAPAAPAAPKTPSCAPHFDSARLVIAPPACHAAPVRWPHPTPTPTAHALPLPCRSGRRPLQRPRRRRPANARRPPSAALSRRWRRGRRMCRAWTPRSRWCSSGWGSCKTCARW